MKLRDIYGTAVRMGIEADPRGKAGVDEFLARTKKRFDALPDHLKALADPEELTNPFNDTRIYLGDPDLEVETLIGGIDMNTAEVLLADRLREKGVSIDAIYTHHPEGWGLTKLDSVMEVQADIWAGLGVPIQAGERLIKERMDEVRRRLMPINYDQAIDAARLLEVPFFSAHTPTDNLVVDYLNKYFAKKKPTLIEDVQKALLEIPEYRIAARKGAGPYIGKSSPGARAGKVWVDMTGGTEGPKTVIEKLAAGGVGTIVGMHMGQELRDEADKHSIHVVIAGHMSSDSLGINIFLDELERNGVKTIATSGLTRVHRDNKGKVVKEEPGALPAR
ncbi:MAG: NGG1p interacting factor NIF3 [Actinobacteria bacterium]|nr:NGG1p interacting factor NIF3 [Actinomycetota bacterium]